MKKRANPNSKSNGQHDNTDLECPICLDKFKHVAETSCGHCFCAECITTHLKLNDECPVCRSKIASVHPSYTLRRVVENHLKRENIPLEEGYHKKQRELDAKLKDISQLKQQTVHNKAAFWKLAFFLLVIALIVAMLQLDLYAGRKNEEHRSKELSQEQLRMEQLNIEKQAESLQSQQPPLPYSPPNPSNSPNTPNSPSSSSLNHYASVGNVPSVVRLLEEGNKDVSTALIEAAKGGHSEVVKLLVKHGADICMLDCVALVEASRGGHYPVVQALLEAGALPNSAIENGMYAVHHAADQGHTSVVKKLLDHGAQINIRSDPFELTPLYLASRAGHTECVRLLLKRGATVDSESVESATPLYVAAEFGRTDVVKLLAGAGANIETHMQSGATPLVIATQKNFREIVEFLLKRGAQTGIIGANRMNALHLATFNGHTECVRMLLEAAALTDEVDSDGNTALHHAVLKAWNTINQPGGGGDEVGRLISSISLLLRHGANPSPSPNNLGEVVESYTAQSQVLARAFSGVKRIECKIIPLNTMDASSMLPMNSISSMREVLLRVESDYAQKVTAIATSEFSDAIKVSELDPTTMFLSELADSSGSVVLRVFFKTPKPYFVVPLVAE